MTTNNVHFLAGGRRISQVLVADRNQGESAIAKRAIKRHSPYLEVRPVTSLAEAESVLAQRLVARVFVASGLDDRTHQDTIRWFALKGRNTIIIALLEHCDDRQGQEALEAGASYFCSKPGLLVAQLRREAAERLADDAMQRPVHVAQQLAIAPPRLRVGQLPSRNVEERS